MISSKREIEKLGIEELAIALNRLIFLSYQKGENERRWMFAEIGKAHTPTERDGRVRMESETV